MNKNIFAVDIGGSKLICGVVSPLGEVIDTYRVDFFSVSSIEAVTEGIKAGFEHLKHYDLGCCGVAIPGLCDPDSGEWLYSPFSGISNIPITKIVEEITGLCAYGDNDVNVCALGERYFGLCRDIDDFLWVTVSNGIGGGLFLSGKLYRGYNLTAGEIGHFIVEENSENRCGCKNYGCLEAISSGASISAIYKKRTGKAMTAKDIAFLARAGEADAALVWSEAGAYIGKAVSYAVNLLGLDTVILGGGAAEAFDLLLPSAEKALEKYVFKKANPNTKILHSGLGYFAALKGCAAIALDGLKND